MSLVCLLVSSSLSSLATSLSLSSSLALFSLYRYQLQPHVAFTALLVLISRHCAPTPLSPTFLTERRSTQAGFALRYKYIVLEIPRCFTLPRLHLLGFSSASQPIIVQFPKEGLPILPRLTSKISRSERLQKD